MKTFGFIGCGRMGQSLAKAILKKIEPERILISNRSPKKAEDFSKETGCILSSNMTIASEAYFIFLAVKPQMMSEVLSEITPVLASRKQKFVLITMAPGITIASLRASVGNDYPVIRIMPNTPVSIGQGMIQYTYSEVPKDDIDDFLSALSAVGSFDLLPENLMDAAGALSGCGPAFIYMMIEAMADGGVSVGIPRDKAITYAAKTMLGAAAMVLETNEHPGALKDNVCSPGGSTIEGVRALENGALRGTLMNAIRAAFERNKELGLNELCTYK